MAALNPSTLETHPTGTINKNGIITGNWEILNAILNPNLSDTDPTYGALYGVLENAVNGQRGMVTLTSGTTLNIDMSTARMKKLLVAHDVTTINVNNKKGGREVVILITADASTRALTWNGSHKWASTPITSIPAGKSARITIACTDTTNSGVYLSGTIEP